MRIFYSLMILVLAVVLPACQSVTAPWVSNAGKAQYTHKSCELVPYEKGKGKQGIKKVCDETRLYNTKNINQLAATVQTPTGVKITLDEEGVSASDPMRAVTQQMIQSNQMMQNMMMYLMTGQRPPAPAPLEPPAYQGR